MQDPDALLKHLQNTRAVSQQRGSRVVNPSVFVGDYELIDIPFVNPMLGSDFRLLNADYSRIFVSFTFRDAMARLWFNRPEGTTGGLPGIEGFQSKVITLKFRDWGSMMGSEVWADGTDTWGDCQIYIVRVRT